MVSSSPASHASASDSLRLTSPPRSRCATQSRLAGAFQFKLLLRLNAMMNPFGHSSVSRWSPGRG
eukprot:3110373-Rhodomonas_salina.1